MHRRKHWHSKFTGGQAVLTEIGYWKIKVNGRFIESQSLPVQPPASEHKACKDDKLVSPSYQTSLFRETRFRGTMFFYDVFFFVQHTRTTKTRNTCFGFLFRINSCRPPCAFNRLNLEFVSQRPAASRANNSRTPNYRTGSSGGDRRELIFSSGPITVEVRLIQPASGSIGPTVHTIVSKSRN